MQYEENINTAKTLAEKVAEKGGRAYYVGGFVRDRLQGIENKDIDIEVHGITPDVLEKILSSIGGYISAGKSFGVYKLAHHSIDIALPRKETMIGKGHRDFKVDVDPFIGTEKAAMRRDFTVNALMQDVLTGEIIDHFGGQKDLKQGILRHINDNSFGEDSLRVLRGAQFAARFDFTIAPETVELCKKIDLKNLSSERVLDELKKALLKAENPSIFFEKLREMEQLSFWFPEVEKLIGIPQHSVHHKEGDVWTHTMMVLDEAARVRNKAEEPFFFMLSALVHDFGKITSTEFVKDDYHAYSHEREGLPIVKEFLHRITNENALFSYVLNMTELHMKPHTLVADNSSIKATNKMFDSAKSPGDLILLALCDGLGKIPQKPSKEAEEFLRERLGIFMEYMSRPFVTGQDLINAGIKPGEEFTEILRFAHKLRLSGESKENILKQILKKR
ncbi:MAG: HD domain-containing protein [Ruminococcaceae bacterium]|nr:HD domain-containing protein [Oscillospiraceae bacterium]